MLDIDNINAFPYDVLVTPSTVCTEMSQISRQITLV